MALSDLQLRLREIGRIRLGDKADNGAPRRLEKFRLTSADRRVLEEAATLYGGTVRAWKGSPGQYELYITADELPLYITPHAALTQWYELWSGGGCKRRCNGQWNEITDGPCECDPEKRECKPTTRLPVMLYELSGVGIWRLETKGYYSAVELPGAAELLRVRAEQGGFLPAAIAIEQRIVKRDGQTKKFPVPVIRLREKLVNLLRAVAPAPQQQIGGQSQPLAIAARSDEADARKKALRELRTSPAWTIAPDDRGGTVAEVSRVLNREVTVETFGTVTADELVAVRMILESVAADAWSDGTEEAPAAPPATAAPATMQEPMCDACGLRHAPGQCPTLDGAPTDLGLEVEATATSGNAQLR